MQASNFSASKPQFAGLLILTDIASVVNRFIDATERQAESSTEGSLVFYLFLSYNRDRNSRRILFRMMDAVMGDYAFGFVVVVAAGVQVAVKAWEIAA